MKPVQMGMCVAVVIGTVVAGAVGGSIVAAGVGGPLALVFYVGLRAATIEEDDT